MNIIKIFPQAFTSTVVDEIKDFQHLNGILAKLNPAYIRDSFIFGLAITVITVIIFICIFLRPHFSLVPYRRDLSLLIMIGLAILLIKCTEETWWVRFGGFLFYRDHSGIDDLHGHHH